MHGATAGRSTRRAIGLLILLAWLASNLVPFGAARAAEPLLFGVLNQQTAVQTAERWNPILQYLSRKTGIPLRLAMGPTVRETDDMMARGSFDLLFSNHNFQHAHDGVYRVLARWAGPPVQGALVVARDSPWRTLADLEGRTVAFPSTEAFLAYVVPTAALRAAGVTVTARTAGHQDGALAQLKAGLVDAAGVNTRFLARYAQREGLSYRTLFVSEPFSEIPVLVHPRVADRQARALQKALLGMARDPEAAALLKAVDCQGFVAATDSDYANVRRAYRAITP